MLPKTGIGTTGVSNLEVKTSITNRKKKWQDRWFFFFFFFFYFNAKFRTFIENTGFIKKYSFIQMHHSVGDFHASQCLNVEYHKGHKTSL